MPVAKTEDDAKKAGIDRKPLRSAREGLGIKPRKAKFLGGWEWSLPSEDAQGATRASSLGDGGTKMPEGAEDAQALRHQNRASWGGEGIFGDHETPVTEGDL